MIKCLSVANMPAIWQLELLYEWWVCRKLEKIFGPSKVAEGAKKVPRKPG